MFNKIKDFISNVANDVIPEPTIEDSQEKKIINNFERFIDEMRVHDNFPKKGIAFLENILQTINEMQEQNIGLQEQVTIRKIVEQDITQVVNIYLSLPKAHAVSFILENGKTAKDTLIEKLSSQEKQISSIWEETVIEATNQLIKKQKATTRVAVAKVDFFDL